MRRFAADMYIESKKKIMYRDTDTYVCGHKYTCACMYVIHLCNTICIYIERGIENFINLFFTHHRFFYVRRSTGEGGRSGATFSRGRGSGAALINYFCSE